VFTWRVYCRGAGLAERFSHLVELGLPSFCWRLPSKVVLLHSYVSSRDRSLKPSVESTKHKSQKLINKQKGNDFYFGFCFLECSPKVMLLKKLMFGFETVITF
jgi:hypothetical protein